MAIGRPLQFDPDIALEKAMHVFWEEGYDGTSLQDLMSATGLSKSSLYQTFESKDELFNRCVARYLDMLAEQMMDELTRAASGRQFVEDTFRGVAGGVRGAAAKKGCLLWNTVLEFGQSDPTVSKRVHAGIERFSKVFETAVRRAQADGEMPTDKDPAALGRYLMSSLGGLRSMLKAGITKSRASEIADLIIEVLD